MQCALISRIISSSSSNFFSSYLYNLILITGDDGKVERLEHCTDATFAIANIVTLIALVFLAVLMCILIFLKLVKMMKGQKMHSKRMNWALAYFRWSPAKYGYFRHYRRHELSHDMWFPTMWYVRPAMAQTSLCIHADWSEPLLFAWIFCKC